MTKFELKDHVRRIGSDKTFTVEQIRTESGKETLYCIQFGTDFATREWGKECELELADVKTPSEGTMPEWSCCDNPTITDVKEELAAHGGKRKIFKCLNCQTDHVLVYDKDGKLLDYCTSR